MGQSKSVIITKGLFLAALALWFVSQPIIITALQVSPALAQDSLDEGDATSPEDTLGSETATPNDSLEDLEWIYQTEGNLILSPQDKNALVDERVDVRVTDYLLYLVKPVEAGGAGFKHIKAARILKNYDTNGHGKLDRETLAATEEDNGLVSVHNTGQAVDISEVGEVTCKAVERRHLGGSTTHFQGAKPIQVAWQSRDGINNRPTPKGPSVTEITGSLASDSLLQMLNASGEMDYAAEYVKGLKIEDVLLYIGANTLLKQFGITKITTDPRSDTIIRSLGAATMLKALPGLPEGLIVAENDEDVQVGIAKANIESLLGLAPGSLRGTGWKEILDSAGKRTVENALGLPALHLETHSLKESITTDSTLAALNHYAKGDNAFAVIAGTIEKIKDGDEAGLTWAGVGVLADAFRLTSNQRAVLEAAAKKNTDPDLNIESFAIDKNIPVTSLAKLLVSNSEKQKEALEELRQYGANYSKELASKVLPKQYQALGEGVLNDLIAGRAVKLGSVKERLGTDVLAEQTGTEAKDVTKLSGGSKNNKTIQAISTFFNKELNLTGNNEITNSNVSALFSGNGQSILEKIGGAQADKAIGWNAGTGLEIIKREKKIDVALQEVFGNGISTILGLEPGSNISLSGDIYANYGQTITEQRLGLKPGSLSKKTTAQDFTADELSTAFGQNDEQWRETDLRLGVTLGTTEAFVDGRLESKQLAAIAAKENLTVIGIDQLWNYFDLDERYRLKKEPAELLINTIRTWDKADIAQKEKAQQAALSLVGRSLDKRANFSVDTILTIVSGDGKAATDALLNEGMKLLAGAIGVNIDNFKEKDLEKLAKQLNQAFSGEVDVDALLDTIAKGTGIPIEDKEALKSFVNGNYRQGLEYWSSAMWTEFANKFLPSTSQVSYQDFRNAVNFADSGEIDLAAQKFFDEQTDQGDFSALPTSARNIYFDDARRRLMQESRDNAQYKISDAFLLQAGVLIPDNFSKVMLSGSDAERGQMVTSAATTYLEPELAKAIPGYQAGMLERLYDKKLTASDNEALISGLISELDLNLGPFSAEFVKSFYQFAKASNRESFYTSSEHQGMWNFLDGWLSDRIGLDGLPGGYAKSLYFASQNGFDVNKSLQKDGQVVVPSIKQLGQDLVISKLGSWADNAMGLPVGSAFKMYEAIKTVDKAEQALAVARALGGDPKKVADAVSKYNKAQNELAVIAITMALNACSACQAFFASVDQAIAAPPGFTNAAVAGAIAMAFGLGPSGLIVAAAIYLFGVYRVDYLCPIPPPDRYSLTQFDPEFDRLDFNYGDYYSDPGKLVKDTPAAGENPFDWDDGVPFKNGNDPSLWMAWSRYFTGRLLDATMTYGATQSSKDQPRQIITLRQANVEFFGPRSSETFGEIEKDNPKVGLGYSQKSTKTTDWVHVSFGGFY